MSRVMRIFLIALSAALAGQGVHVAELRVLETSLEEYFLEVTE